MYYLPNELWDIVKTYQLNWKPTHKKKFGRVMNELKYTFYYLCCYRGCQRYTVHKITGYFHKCYFTLLKTSKKYF
jgi:hypothetical protein